ncbi:MAG TPA: hypothetical protein VFS00_31870, partial [Polyangiaceae bacterium]|nr:hypothetical protein [Polyangiaceae bacterium]
CSRCGDWPDVSYELEGGRWCGTCAPWSRAPCPLGPLIELGRRVRERLDGQGRRAASSDTERMIAWLESAAAAWPGPDPWRTVRLATQMQQRLLFLEREPANPRPPAAPRARSGARSRARKFEPVLELAAFQAAQGR